MIRVKTFLNILLLVGSSLLTTSISHAENLEQSIQSAIPNTPVKSVSPLNLSLDDLYLVEFKNGRNGFITQDKRYLVLGAIIDLKTGKILNNGVNTHA